MEVYLADLSSLQINIYNVIFTVKVNRERYANFGLVLIHPFQTFNDLKDNHTGLYWDKFVILMDSHSLYKKDITECIRSNSMQETELL